ncbi:MAG: hypothetical protein AVDCRST_MAG88-697, partial [uncultured Thermomicrobiales bacterium]
GHPAPGPAGNPAGQQVARRHARAGPGRVVRGDPAEPRRQRRPGHARRVPPGHHVPTRLLRRPPRPAARVRPVRGRRRRVPRRARHRLPPTRPRQRLAPPARPPPRARRHRGRFEQALL